jgi:hypothetical protein
MADYYLNPGSENDCFCLGCMLSSITEVLKIRYFRAMRHEDREISMITYVANISARFINLKSKGLFFLQTFSKGTLFTVPF